MGMAPMGLQELAALKKIRLVDMDEAAVKHVVATYRPHGDHHRAGHVREKPGEQKAGAHHLHQLRLFHQHPRERRHRLQGHENPGSNLKEFYGTSKAARHACGRLRRAFLPAAYGAKRYKEVGAKGC